jgi:hypothetical protein
MKLPDNLTKFLQRCPELMHLDIEVTPPDVEMLDAWFGTDNGGYERFLHPFSQDGTGSIIALWDPSGDEDYSSAPVVYLGSEGEIGVYGSDFNDCLRLIATGLHAYDLVLWNNRTPFEELLQDADELAEASKNHQSYVRWLEEKCGMKGPFDADALLAKQAEIRKNLEAWIEERTAAN